MRARNIKPGFFKNAELAELDSTTRLLFIGLWCMADRKGRLVDRPKQIKGELLAYESITPEQVSTMLDQLQHRGFLMRYEKGEKYIEINHFEKHQHPHCKEQDSTIPAQGKHQTNTVQARLIPDVLIPDSPILKSDDTASRPLDLAGVFNSLWLEYPKRIGKKAAERHFKASVKGEADVIAIREALKRYKADCVGKDPQFIQNGSTWFNNWRDWINYQPMGGKHGANDSAGVSSISAIFERARAIRRAEGLRKIVMPTARKVLDGIRDNAMGQTEAPDKIPEPERGGHGSDGPAMEGIRHDPVKDDPPANR